VSPRRGSGPSLVTILWRDIPAQVVASDGTTVEKAMLPNRFQVAIDRAARIAGKTETAAYVAEWRRTEQPLTGDPAGVVASSVEEIDRSYSRERLATLVRQGGLETAGGPT
jgi:hypothetical protein